MLFASSFRTNIIHVYQRFLHKRYYYHQNISELDFRHSGSARFQLLHTLSQQAQQTVSNNLIQFYSAEFIITELVIPKTFNIQAESFIQLFERTTPQSFLNMLKLIEQTITRNQILSGIDTLFALMFYGPWCCYCEGLMICQLPEGIYANINQYDYPGSYYSYDPPIQMTSMIDTTLILPGSDLSDQDFRHLVPYYFGLLSTFCQSSNETIVDSLTQFYANEYITSQVVLSNLFVNQAVSFIELFTTTTTQQSFKQIFNLIRGVIFGN
ncbi:unnamed protein product [Didymodactylos carnosus]|uniref:Uncharacterized protein n=1 Tax=Didymodactylos carnosus TaxID=1234261 RepID=A0A814ZD93_9BILA|nr:unnamed protein product [Didymodactylos carnosus]CAF4003606.1 unnamed protein product [Didymodactylos carnosus]